MARNYESSIAPKLTSFVNLFKMPVEMEICDENVNQGASTSSAVVSIVEDKKKNQPWIEKYRPQRFEEIMGRLAVFTSDLFPLFLHCSYRQRRDRLETSGFRDSRKHSEHYHCRKFIFSLQCRFTKKNVFRDLRASEKPQQSCVLLASCLARTSAALCSS